MKNLTIRTAFRDTLPVMAGYIFLGIGFGIYLNENGYGLLWAFAMSLFIYAGAMQYVAVSLMTGGASLLTAALTTLMVNARHLFYGLSMIESYKNMGRKKPYLIFSLTDETYSLVSRNQLPEEISRPWYFLFVSAFDQIYWVTGSVLGSLFGAWIPINYEGIDFVLTALFVTIFVEQWLSTKNHFPAMIGITATAVCLFFFGSDIFLIPSMLLIATILMMFPTHKENSHE